MLTKLQMFQKDHSSRFKASFEAICHLSGLTLTKTYYQDNHSGFSIKRTAGHISTSEGGWNHSPNAQEIDKAFKEATMEAKIYKEWCYHWAEEETRTYTFGPFKVSGTRKENGVEWSVCRHQKKMFTLFTDQKELSDTRAEIVFLNFLGSGNKINE